MCARARACVHVRVCKSAIAIKSASCFILKMCWWSAISGGHFNVCLRIRSRRPLIGAALLVPVCCACVCDVTTKSSMIHRATRDHEEQVILFVYTFIYIVCMCVCMYTCIHVHNMNLYIYLYLYRDLYTLLVTNPIYIEYISIRLFANPADCTCLYIIYYLPTTMLPFGFFFRKKKIFFQNVAVVANTSLALLIHNK